MSLDISEEISNANGMRGRWRGRASEGRIQQRLSVVFAAEVKLQPRLTTELSKVSPAALTRTSALLSRFKIFRIDERIVAAADQEPAVRIVMDHREKPR